jgi:hypothetical protein
MSRAFVVDCSIAGKPNAPTAGIRASNVVRGAYEPTIHTTRKIRVALPINIGCLGIRLTAIGLILLLAAASSSAQQVPSGTILPTMLDNTLDSSSTKPGQQISAKLRQDVSLPNGQKIKRNSKVLGHVVAVSGGNPVSITLQFDRLAVGKSPVPIAVTLRALASMEAVSDAKTPANPNSGYGTTSWDWNMLLIGGQAAFNGQRVVKSQDGKVVGKVVEPGAIVGEPMANPVGGCTAGSNEQAFWLFSTDACGTYGYKDLTIEGSGNSSQIVLQSRQKIVIRSGSGWLLQTK